MKLLADANIESAVIRWLRSCGHDVIWAAELPPSTPDVELVEQANRDGRLFITYDRDFGELIYFQGRVTQGIVLLRFEAALQSERLNLLQRHWGAIQAQAPGHFMVVSERNVRVRPLP